MKSQLQRNANYLIFFHTGHKHISSEVYTYLYELSHKRAPMVLLVFSCIKELIALKCVLMLSLKSFVVHFFHH